jgi:hypothetical protein
MTRMTIIRNTKYERRTTGSAILLAIVLTSLLAIVGVIFLLSSRVDLIATSAISENKDLNLAVDTVIARISEELSLDVPYTDPNGIIRQEYYDYPGGGDYWLASLEPNDANLWPHITDLYYRLGSLAYNVLIIAPSAIIPEYQPVVVADELADADGDGVIDSIWVKIPDKTSSKGKSVFAAVRIIDNGGMLNVNTGYKFDPCDVITRIDGSSQTQINLMALSALDNTHVPPWQPVDTRQDRLLSYRCGSESNNIGLYEQNVVWQYGLPVGAYTPFDISDELKLRNRYVINHNLETTRIETLWTNAFDGPPYKPRYTPYNNINDPNDWFWIVSNNYPAPCSDPCVYDNRHIATTYNMDRVINPGGGKMVNINTAGTSDILAAIRLGLIDANAAVDVNALAAQITANLIDYRDDDNEITVVRDDANIPHFGFETPCIYISEIAQNFFQWDINDSNHIWYSYAIELHKPYSEDPLPNGWQLVIKDPGGDINIPIVWTGSGRFHVLLNDNYDLIKFDLNDINVANAPYPLNGAVGVKTNVILNWPAVSTATRYKIYFGTDQSAVSNADPTVYKAPPTSTTIFNPGLLVGNTTYYWRIDPFNSGGTLIYEGPVWRFTISDAIPQPSPILDFNSGSIIELHRRVYDPCYGPIDVTVDSVVAPVADLNGTGWLEVEINNPSEPNLRYATHSFQRDISPHKPIRRLWDFLYDRADPPTIGYTNIFVDTENPEVIQAHPANKQFTNVGEFGQLFYCSTYGFTYGGVILSSEPNYRVTEPNIRIDLALPGYQQVFKYLTVMDPNNHNQPADETKIKGRININTAPWFVLAQLPWVSYQSWDLARSIVDYRNAYGPFKSTGELINVGIANADPCNFRRMDFYAKTGQVFPALTPADGTNDYFEKRDAIFTRISNLVTVRSDVFTAYILVRIGQNGPQKRVVAILDRSGVTPAGGKVKVIAIQQVPDAR